MSKFIKAVSSVLKANPRSINDETSPANAKNWDSFRGLLLIMEIEKEFGAKFSMEEILYIKNIGDIKKILKGRNIDTER